MLERTSRLDTLAERTGSTGSRLLDRRADELDALRDGCLRTKRFTLDPDRPASALSRPASSVGIRPTLAGSANYKSSPLDWQLRRERHDQLLREVAEDEHRARILPKEDRQHSWSRLNDFVSELDERDLRYLTRQGRET